MAYYKKQKYHGKWYPRSLTVGTLTTRDVADRLSRMSTITRADTYAVLIGLGEVLGDMMATGHSVKLDGIGTFYLVGKADGCGVDTPEEVSPRQFRRLAVGFIPEYRRGSNGRVLGRTIVPDHVEWTERDAPTD